MSTETVQQAEPKPADLSIEKVKFTKEGAELTFKSNSVIKEEAVLDGNTLSRSKQPHPDLIQAFKVLVPHFLLLSGLNPIKIDEAYLKERKIVTEENLQVNAFEIYGFSVSGEGDSESVQLLGKVKTPYGKTIAIPCPKVSLVGDGGYPHKEILLDDLNEAIEETEAYYKGKWAPNPQLVIFKDDTDGR